MMEEFWVAKYALTRGVFRIAGSVSRSGSSWAHVSESPMRDGHIYPVLILGQDVFRSNKEAVERSIVLATKKIAANNNNNAKLDDKISQWNRML